MKVFPGISQRKLGLVIFDILAITISLFAATYSHVLSSIRIESWVIERIPGTMVIMTGWILILFINSAYDWDKILKPVTHITLVLKSVVVVLIVVAAVAYFYPSINIKPHFLNSHLLAVVPILLLSRYIAVRFLFTNFPSTQIITVGSDPLIREIVGYLSNTSRPDIILSGSYLFSTDPEQNVHEMHKLTSVSWSRTKIKQAIFSKENEQSKEFYRLLVKLRKANIQLISANEFYEKLTDQIPIIQTSDRNWFFDWTYVFSHHTRTEIAQDIFNVLVATVLILLTVPFMLLISLIILLEDGWPILFIQNRVGKSGKIFSLIKFRTMKEHDAQTHSPYAQEDDPRILLCGKVLRKTRLDELPQLFNILLRDMNLVGPRAEWHILARNYKANIPFYNYRHCVPPGVTGWAQVKYKYGQNLDDTIEKLKYDFYYLKHRSILFDLYILIRTIKVIIWGKS